MGLAPARILYAEAREDAQVFALAEDGLCNGALAGVVAEVRRAGMTATRRLQLAAAEGGRRSCSNVAGALPLSLGRALGGGGAMRMASAPSAPLCHPGIGRSHWTVELARQRGGETFSLLLEACDDQGRLALPAPARHRAPRAERAAARAA